jgi:hypothetical protein
MRRSPETPLRERCMSASSSSPAADGPSCPSVKSVVKKLPAPNRAPRTPRLLLSPSRWTFLRILFPGVPHGVSELLGGGNA